MLCLLEAITSSRRNENIEKLASELGFKFATLGPHTSQRHDYVLMVSILIQFATHQKQ